MLCQFTFCNFKSYKNETVFDFQAEPLPEFSDTLLGEDKGGKLLPVSVVYGAKRRREEQFAACAVLSD